MAAIYRDLAEDHPRMSQVTGDVCEALARGRHCLVLTQWTAHLERLTAALQAAGHDPVVLRGRDGSQGPDRCPGPAPATLASAANRSPRSQRPLTQLKDDDADERPGTPRNGAIASI